MTTQTATITADTKFLKRILFGLVAATIIAGALAGVATVNAGPQSANYSLFEVHSNTKK